MKPTISIRLDEKDLEWLDRNGRTRSSQIRRDLRTLRMLCSFVEEGMSDHPLGKMMLMADNEFKEDS